MSRSPDVRGGRPAGARGAGARAVGARGLGARNLGVRIAGAVGGGLLTGLAFPPGIDTFAPHAASYAAAVAGLALTVAAVRGAGVGAAALVGLLGGAAMLVVSLRWLSVIGPIALGPLVAFEALFAAAAGAGTALVLRLRGWVLWVPAVWVLAESARSRVPFGGFAWARLGYLAVDTPFAGLARIGSVALETYVLVLLACLVLAAGESVARVVRRAGSGGRLRAAAPAVAGLIVTAVLLAIGSLVPAWTSRTGDPTVALVQGSVPGKGLDFLGRARTVTRNHRFATERLAAEVRAGKLPAPRFVVWPENSTDIDPVTDAATNADIDAAVAAAGVPILVGAVVEGPDGRSRNSGIVWDPGSGPSDIYVKRHLVPFGEFVPLRGLITTLVPMVARYIPEDMAAGTRSGALDIAGLRIGDMLCFDTAYDDSARADVRAGAGILVVQTNNATYTGTGQPDQQWQITRFDAIAFGRSAVVSSTNGRSGVIGPDGRVLGELPVIAQGWMSTPVEQRAGSTPAVWLAPGLEGAVATLAALAVAAAAVRSRRRPDRPRAGRPAAPGVGGRADSSHPPPVAPRPVAATPVDAGRRSPP